MARLFACIICNNGDMSSKTSSLNRKKSNNTKDDFQMRIWEIYLFIYFAQIILHDYAAAF